MLNALPCFFSVTPNNCKSKVLLAIVSPQLAMKTFTSHYLYRDTKNLPVCLGPNLVFYDIFPFDKNHWEPSIEVHIHNKVLKKVLKVVEGMESSITPSPLRTLVVQEEDCDPGNLSAQPHFFRPLRIER